jgi:hypothetical protein
MRGCAYAGGNGFYLFAKANSVGSGNYPHLLLALAAALKRGGYALGLTVAARQNGAYARTPSLQS